MTEPLAIAESLIEVVKTTDKPVLASWMGGDAVAAAREALNAAGVPTYDYPDEAARAFQFMWQRHERLRFLEETNRLACADRPPMTAVRERIGSLLQREMNSDPLTHPPQRLLNEIEAKSVLAAAGIPVLETLHSHSEDEAVALAEHLGFPVVLKLQSPTITHKTDVGGVCLDLQDEAAVRAAWQRIQAAVSSADFDGVTVQRMIRQHGIELICGCSLDEQFGPVLLFGAGGVWVEIMQDRVLMLPPLSRDLALDRLRQTRIHRALAGTRNQPPSDLNAIADVLVKLGDLVLAIPEIRELDINPLLATADGVLALDARIVVSGNV
jgi:acetyltransferase